MRALRILPLLLLLAFTTAHSQSPAEKALFDLANQARTQIGLQPLTWDPALANAARQHLSVVLQHPGTLEHDYPGEPNLVARGGHSGAHFSTIAENLAADAHSPGEIHQSWMMSPAHRYNLLDPKLTAVGIAVAQLPNGTLTAVQDFGHTNADLSDNAIEQQVQKLLVQQGIQPNNSPKAKEDARENCATGAIPEQADPRPTLSMQFECTDLSQLPPQILQHLPTNAHPPKTAAVGACPARQSNQGFTTYRLGILLY